jgi:hypothetical protein
MQYIIGKIAWFMQQCLHTTAAEVDKYVATGILYKKISLVDDCSCQYICWNE